LLTSCLLAVATAPSRLAAQSPLPHYASGVLSAVPLPSSSQPHLSAAPPFGGANITVNSPTGGQQNETTIAVNPNSPSNLIGGANDYRTGDSRCGRYISANNGRTWTDLTPFGMFTPAGGYAFTAAGDPGIAFDADGHAYYLCMYFTRNPPDPGNDATQYVHKSNDGGATWGPPIQVSAAAPQSHFDDKGHIAVDNKSLTANRGNIYVAWARLDTGELRFARSTNGGVSFINDQVIDTCNCSGANIAVGSDGAVYVAVWSATGGSPDSNIVIYKSTNGGQSFGGGTTIATFNEIGSGAGVRPLTRTNSFPSIGTDPSDANLIYAIWPQRGPGTDDSDIAFSRSTNGGSVWSAPIRVNDDINPGGDFNSQFFPWLAVDPTDGSINAVWYDDRLDPNHTDATPLVDLFFASSTNGGLSFSLNKRISTQSSDTTVGFGSGANQFFGDYNAIAAHGGVAYPLWTDSRNGTQDVMTTQVGGADLAISKTARSTTVAAGTQLIYDLTVTNNGPAVAFNVVVTDTLPGGVTYVSSTDTCIEAPVGTLTCQVGNLASGDSNTFSIQVKVNANVAAGTTLTNNAMVASDQEDPFPGNNTATAAVIVTAQADLQLTKQCKPDGPIAAGGTATCTILVTNLGPSDAQNVVVTDILLSNGPFTIVSATFSPPPNTPCVIAANIVTCNLGTVAAGAVVTITVQVTSNTQADVNDVATVTSSTPDPNTANNTATGVVHFVGAADLAITKNSAPNPVIAGTNITYNITVTNAGPSTAVNVVMKDTLPAQISDVSFTPSQGSCIGGIPGNPALPLTCNLGSIASGGNATVTIVAKVDPATPGGTILVNNAVVSSDTSDSNNANNNATALTTVSTRADVAIVKTSDALTYKPSSKITYRIDVTNNGESVARAVVVTDNLPDVHQALYQSDTGGCLRNSATNPTQLRCELGDLKVGESRTFFVVLLVRGNKGTVSNTALVSSTTLDPNGGNNSSTLNVTVGK